MCKPVRFTLSKKNYIFSSVCKYSARLSRSVDYCLDFPRHTFPWTNDHRQKSIRSSTRTSRCCEESRNGMVGDLPRSTLHQMLSAEYDQHVYAAVVEYPCPVFHHPDSCILMLKIVFEIENIRIVRGQLHFGCGFVCSAKLSSFLAPSKLQ